MSSFPLYTWLKSVFFFCFRFRRSDMALLFSRKVDVCRRKRSASSEKKAPMMEHAAIKSFIQKFSPSTAIHWCHSKRTLLRYPALQTLTNKWWLMPIDFSISSLEILGRQWRQNKSHRIKRNRHQQRSFQFGAAHFYDGNGSCSFLLTRSTHKKLRSINSKQYIERNECSFQHIIRHRRGSSTPLPGRTQQTHTRNTKRASRIPTIIKNRNGFPVNMCRPYHINIFSQLFFIHF